LQSLGVFYAHCQKFFFDLKTALAERGFSSYDPAASNRPRPTLFFYQLIYAVFVSMGDRQPGRFAHQDRGKRNIALSRGRCVALALGSVAQAHRDE
jgi:hypothetical protein